MRILLNLIVLVVASITCLNAQTAMPVMVKVEGGTFNMGSNSEGEYGAQPVHSVTVSSFSISKYPVTVAQYKAFCLATNHPMPFSPHWGWNDDDPMVKVTYDDALEYCNWLSDTYNGNYRLPYEAEWEYAAHGGNKSKGYTYSGGNDLDEVGWFADNSGRQTHPVGTKKPNELGLYDMSGNVWEWCRDLFSKDYYSSSPSSNPRGPSTGNDRVLRGGSWGSAANICRVTHRYLGEPEDQNFNYGFRVVSPE